LKHMMKEKMKEMIPRSVTIAAVLLILFGAIIVTPTTTSTSVGGLGARMEFHVTAYIQRAGEAEPSLWSYHAGVITTIGLNWVEDQLGDSPGADPAKWISLSSDAGPPSAAWTQLPSEIVTGGLIRVAGAYASTGNGMWTISKTFTANATTVGVQLVGIHWAASGNNNLMWSDLITSVTLNSGDKMLIVATAIVT